MPLPLAQVEVNLANNVCFRGRSFLLLERQLLLTFRMMLSFSAKILATERKEDLTENHASDGFICSQYTL